MDNRFSEQHVGATSGGSYTGSTAGGGLGRYGMTPSQRASVCASYPVSCVSDTDFRNCPALQDQYFDYLVRDMRDQLAALGAFDYVGRVVDGVLITASGLVGAALFTSPSAVNSFLSSDGSSNPTGPDGRTVRDSLLFFAGNDVFKPDPGCPTIPPPVAPPPPPTAATCGGSSICTASSIGSTSPTPPATPPAPPTPPATIWRDRCGDTCDHSHAYGIPFGLYYQTCVGTPENPSGDPYSRYANCCPCNSPFRDMSRCSCCSCGTLNECPCCPCDDDGDGIYNPGAGDGFCSVC